MMNKLTEYLVLARSRASDLENVRKLNCWGSSLNDVSILQRMPNIQVVSLSVNEITSLADFAYCVNLEEIYIRKNNIQDLSEICHLCKLPKLRNLWLADNPCASGDLYRLTVLRTLPNLQKLDNVAVQQEEINEALERGLVLKLGKGAVTSAVTPPPTLECACNCSQPASRAHRSPSASPARNSLSMSPSRQSPSNSPARHSPCTSPAHTKTKDLTETRRRGESERVDEEEWKEENPITLTWEETNKIRAQLGLRLLPVEKVTPLKPRSFHTARQRNANILQACLHLVSELDVDSLEVVADAIRNKMELL